MAAFPEKHPHSPDPETDVRYFVAKCRAGADFAITNMFFYPEDYLRLRDRVAAQGCDMPIIPGIMPITSLRVIEKALELGGCRVPTELWERLQAVADDRAAVREIGVDSRPGCASGCSPRACPACTSTRSTGPGRPGRSTSGSVLTSGASQRGSRGSCVRPERVRSGSSAPITA